MWPFGGLLARGGVFLTDKTEETTGAGINRNQNIKFFDDGGWGEAGFGGMPSGGTYSIYDAEWWAGHPVTGIGAGFEVRNSNIVSGGWDNAYAAVGDWVNISNNPWWGITRTGGKGGEGAGSQNIVADFEIRASGGGPVLASCQVDLTTTHT